MLSFVAALVPVHASDAGGCRWDHGVFIHGRQDREEIALTFDACPTTLVPSFSTAIFDLLERERIPATVFVSGRWAEQNRAQFARLAAATDIELALHGYGHRHLLGGVRDVTDKEIRLGREAFRKLGAEPAPLFRPPYGEAPQWLGRRASLAGFTPVLWDVVTGDPDPRISARRIKRTVLEEVRGGSIVVMHINGGGVHTAEALPAVVRGLRERGLRFVTVGQLLDGCKR